MIAATACVPVESECRCICRYCTISEQIKPHSRPRLVYTKGRGAEIYFGGTWRIEKVETARLNTSFSQIHVEPHQSSKLIP